MIFKVKIFKELQEAKLKNLVLPMILLLIVIVAGTAGYHILWMDTGVSWIDALYMTIITITTVGYLEVHPLGDMGRIFTMFVSVLGIASLFYVLGIFMENLFMIQLLNLRGKRKMQKKIDNLEEHIILVGYGRVGKLAAKELLSTEIDVVIIDDDFQKEEFPVQKEHFYHIVGDATHDEILNKAGIKRAKGIIVATANSATTLFVIFSARVLNPDLFIVARADDETSIEKLEKAGADRVVNPYSTGGQRLAGLMINPNLIDFFETGFGNKGEKIDIEKIIIPQGFKYSGKSLLELDFRKKFGITVMAVIRKGKVEMNPGGAFNLNDSDQLVLMGNKDRLRKFMAEF